MEYNQIGIQNLDNGAEKALKALAVIVLILGILGAGFAFLACLMKPETIVVGVFLAPVIVVYAILIWSVLKVFANISLTLKDINRKMKE